MKLLDWNYRRVLSKLFASLRRMELAAVAKKLHHGS
jgi:adenine-specific DNA glycosylase